MELGENENPTLDTLKKVLKSLDVSVGKIEDKYSISIFSLIYQMLRQNFKQIKFKYFLFVAANF